MAHQRGSLSASNDFEIFQDADDESGSPQPSSSHIEFSNEALHNPFDRSTPTPSPLDRFIDLVESPRSPPGERAMLAAIDDLALEISVHDSISGHYAAYEALLATLQVSLQNPSRIQIMPQVRAKLQAEYDGLPPRHMVDAAIKDNIVTWTKHWVSQRWRVEAMAQQGYEDWPRRPFGFG